MPDAPIVSVVIPVHNAAGTIREAVDSVLAQTYPAIEVIVVDDGSTDGTGRALQQYGGRVRVLKRAHGGLCAARNAGHAEATGTFVAWLDADDVAHPDRLAAQVEVLERHPEVVLVSTDFEGFDEHGPRKGIHLRTIYGTIDGLGGLESIYGAPDRVQVGGVMSALYRGHVSREIVFGNFVHPPTVMARRSAIRKAGDLRPAYPVADDWLYFIELARVGAFAYIDESLVRYRQSETQITATRGRRGLIAEANLGALEIVVREHADLCVTRPDRLRAAFAERHLDVADALSDGEKADALRHLVRSVRSGADPRGWLRVTAKVLTPRIALNTYRKLRATD